MAKRKRKSRKRNAQSGAALRLNGLKAFKRGDYDQAIAIWLRVSASMRPLSALAEAHFRQGLKHLSGSTPNPSASLDDFKQAVKYQPDDPVYNYHLGLAAHRLGDLESAVQAYQIACRDENLFANRVAFPLALALLQQGQNPLEGSLQEQLQPEERAMLHNVDAFQRRPYILSPEAPLLWRALAMLDAGDLEQAKSGLSDALASANSPVEKQMAHYYLGVLAAKIEDWETARREWSAAYADGLRTERMKNNLAEIFHQEAKNLLSAGDPKAALNAAQKARRHKSDDKALNELVSQIHQHLGYQAALANRWDDAQSHWKTAIETDSGNFRLAYNQALACEQGGDYLTAAEAWREALRRRPRRADHPDALDDEQVARLWQHVAEVYRKANQPDDAIKVYRQAIKWDPDNLSVRLALVEDLLIEDRLESAQSELKRVLTRDKKHIPALLRMGEVLFRSDQWWVREKAPHYWKRILKLESDHFQARQALADYYRDQAEIDYSWDRFSKAIKDYKVALKYQPNHAPTLAAIANCYIQDGDPDSAQSYIEQAIGLAPENVYVFSEIIGACIQVGDHDRAWKVLLQAEESIKPVPVEFYLTHAAQLLEMDEKENAAFWLDSAIEHAPSGEPVLLMIGEMAMDYDDQLARRYLEQAIAAQQSTGQAHLLLGSLADREGDQRARSRHWREAERIARKTRDTELKERLEFARFMAGGPQAVIERLLNLGGPEAVEDFLSFMEGDFDE